MSEELFRTVYERNGWQSDGSKSGAGSSIHSARHLIRELPLVFQELNIRSIVDAPCGDFTWMNEIVPNSIQYTGVDIVKPLINDLVARFTAPNLRFVHGDLTTTPLPQADLVICRDCFIHLPLPMIKTALANFQRSGSTWLLTTHFQWRVIDCNGAIDQVSLGGRRINLELPPFGLPAPRRAISEGVDLDVARDKTLALWRLDELAV